MKRQRKIEDKRQHVSLKIKHIRIMIKVFYLKESNKLDILLMKVPEKVKFNF